MLLPADHLGVPKLPAIVGARVIDEQRLIARLTLQGKGDGVEE